LLHFEIRPFSKELRRISKLISALFHPVEIRGELAKCLGAILASAHTQNLIYLWQGRVRSANCEISGFKKEGSKT